MKKMYFMESMYRSTGDLRLLENPDSYTKIWFNKYPNKVEVLKKEDILSHLDDYEDREALRSFKKAIEASKLILYYATEEKDLYSEYGGRPQTVLGIYEIIL